MHKWNYIHGDLKIEKGSKLIIGIGDSFTYGTGTESFETWAENDWDVEKMRVSAKAQLEASEGSWVNQLCKYHMTDYVPLNLGMAGKGNRYAVRELYLNPLMELEEYEEKYVIFMPSAMERFDTPSDFSDPYYHFDTHWPVSGDPKRPGYSSLKNKDDESIACERLFVSETLLNFYDLINWCELYGAKLLFINAFTPEINRDYFIKTLHGENPYEMNIKIATKLVDRIPWHKQIKPMGYDSVIGMLLHLEERDDLIKNYGFRNFNIETVSKYGWISKCQHPTLKGHKLISDIIYENILNYDNLKPIEIKKPLI